ncbi:MULTISPECIES: S-layer homology domain-containing protein [Anoxybacillus]|uniref:S-layer homology domain-containing protein n=1 Tax=Anoxybacillus gonensis TaxID=198467 RepID=A0AAW7TGT0_9BACL|nr:MULTISPECIES: S-layer homology domain-containing protein [Anoxybacillus]AKS39551.1 S-layer protein [Anoxybacillus gonensis]MDO0878399.1 S-layer homology domain-containing protein [Anoxybacillus gonensis]
MRFIWLTFFFLLLFQHPAHAHVVDLTNKAKAQAYEDYYPLIARYKGTSGVTFESYSTYWNETKLAQLEQELLKNKHGAELSLLGSVKIFPDYPAGQNVLGQYFAQYQVSPKLSLLPNRYIHLYGGNEWTTVEEMATTLAHEYGHHFTYYYLLNKEQRRPNEWLQSQYAAARELFRYPTVHADGSGEYEWYMPEILAEDYVQLFGSPHALKGHMQMNAHLPTPFELQALQTYWKNQLGATYEPMPPLSLLLTNYTVKNNVYSLKLYTYADTTAYLNAQDGQGRYASVYIGSVPKGVNETAYDGTKLNSQVSWLFRSTIVDTALFRVVQPTTKGFNRGSATLRVSYGAIDTLVSTPPLFPDVVREELQEAARLLYERGMISGFPDGTYRPNERLLRRHAALMLIRDLQLTLPEGYVVKAQDVKPTDPWYKEMAIAEAYGLLTGYNGKLYPNDYITRAQMATILTRVYADVYEQPTTNASFFDVPASHWAYQAIDTLFYNGITINNPYRPNDFVTRGQFALFLKRTLDKK